MAKNSTLQVMTKNGEISDFGIIVNVPETNGQLRLSADIPDNGIITSENIRIYSTKQKEDNNEDTRYHKLFGELVDITTKRYYSKLYTSGAYKIKFSKVSYYKFWYEVTTSLEYNSNVIIFRNPIRAIKTVEELQKLIGSGKNIAYKFLKECKTKGYIGVLSYKDNSYYVVNPKYANSGTLMPKTLLGLFDFGERFTGEECQQEETVEDV